MATLRVSRTICDSGPCLVLAGELDISTTELLAQSFGPLLAEPGTEPITIDLRALTFMDSSGLKEVLRHNTSAVSRGRRLLLVPGPAYVQRVFEVTGLDTLLEFIDIGPDLGPSQSA